MGEVRVSPLRRSEFYCFPQTPNFPIKYILLKGRILGIKQKAFDDARKEFELWKSADLRGAYLQLREEAYREAQTDLQRWKIEQEDKIRSDALQRSNSVRIGKSFEQLIPVKIAENLGSDLEDFRFLGSPVDFLVFRGLSAGNPLEVIFLEIKSSSNAQLTEREKLIKQLIESKKVNFMVYRNEI
mgnify:CR=1 FL=1